VAAGSAGVGLGVAGGTAVGGAGTGVAEGPAGACGAELGGVALGAAAGAAAGGGAGTSEPGMLVGFCPLCANAPLANALATTKAKQRWIMDLFPQGFRAGP
jgi:hypothetical protein